MDISNDNWYSEYDGQSLPILKSPNYFTQICSVASTFRDCEGPLINEDETSK
jgi:hypothetical protein